MKCSSCFSDKKMVHIKREKKVVANGTLLNIMDIYRCQNCGMIMVDADQKVLKSEENAWSVS